MKVVTITLSRLRNNEYYRFMMEIVSIISGAIVSMIPTAVTNNDLGTLINKLQELLAKLDVAVISLSKSEYTALVADADTVRDKAYRGFTLYVQAFSNSMDSENVEAARRLQVLIDNYGDFRQRPMNEESAMIDNFLRDLKDLNMDSINTIRGEDWVSEMKDSNEALKNLMDERHDERVAQLREEVRGLRMQIDELYRQTTNLLEIGETLIEGSYSELINQVSERVSYYKTTLATRKGRADAKKEEDGSEDWLEVED